MIYLLITTSINNRYGKQDAEERKTRYLEAISETLRILPREIKPIIVENNGERNTYLDNFYHYGRQHVKVFYTDNNQHLYKNKGINEILDIKEVIEKYGIQDDDIVIKLTGRYHLLSSTFFKDIIQNQDKFDAFVKFFGTCSLQFEENDCILGCFALRAKYFMLYNHLSIQNYNSPEIAFARYIKLSGARLKEMNQLDLECIFAEDNRHLIV